MKKFNNKQRGLSVLGFIILTGIIILVLSYFNISIKAIVESPTGQENVNYIRGGTTNLWTTYLAKPAAYLWNDVVIDIFWAGFIENMKRIRDGIPTNIENAAPQLNLP